MVCVCVCVLLFLQHESATIGKGCRIGPSVVIGPGVVIEDGRSHPLYMRMYISGLHNYNNWVLQQW